MHSHRARNRRVTAAWSKGRVVSWEGGLSFRASTVQPQESKTRFWPRRWKWSPLQFNQFKPETEVNFRQGRQDWKWGSLFTDCTNAIMAPSLHRLYKRYLKLAHSCLAVLIPLSITLPQKMANLCKGADSWINNLNEPESVAVCRGMHLLFFLLMSLQVCMLQSKESFPHSCSELVCLFHRKYTSQSVWVISIFNRDQQV